MFRNLISWRRSRNPAGRLKYFCRPLLEELENRILLNSQFEVKRNDGVVHLVNLDDLNLAEAIYFSNSRPTTADNPNIIAFYLLPAAQETLEIGRFLLGGAVALP